MSDIENVSVEVRELLELVLKKPVQSDTNEPDVLHTDNLIQSMDVQPEIPANTNIDLQRTNVPVFTENKQITIAPEPDLRVIESNALKLIAQYGSDSDSVESDDDTASSDEVVIIDDVESVLQKTITDGNYRVVSSDSEERYVAIDLKCQSVV